MDRSEPALIPEWLKSSGSATAGTYSNHHPASCLQSDDHSLSKNARNKSFINSEHDGSRSFVSERTTSSYFRRSTSGKDSSHSRSHSSFNRSHRHREWEDVHDFRDKDRSILGDRRHHEYPDHIGGVLPGKFSKETLQRSQSMVSRRLEGTTLAKKVDGNTINTSNSNNHIKSSSQPLASVSVPSSTQTSFVRDFPSLGADQKQSPSELRRVPSPVLPSAVHSLPGSPTVIGADGWTSSLAEVPGVIVSSSTASLPSQQAVSGSSASLAQRPGGLNMAEAVAQGPSRARTLPQVSVDTQRREELAIKQSRQLIPVIPSTPKPALLGPSDKSKPKAGQQLAHANQTLRGGPARFDSGKISSNLGKLQVLKPARELNSISSNVVKENLSPKNGVKVVNTPLSLNPTAAAASAPLRIPVNIQTSVGPERKSATIAANLEKRPSSVQAQSRSDFFNLLKKKSSSSASNTPAGNEAVPCAMDKSLDSVAEDSAAAASGGGAHWVTSESKLDGSSNLQTENGGKVMADEEVNEGIHHFVGNGEDQLDIDVPYPSEEEAAFLRSLGWEENAGEDEGLTEDEIRAFFEYMKMKPRREPQCAAESE